MSFLACIAADTTVVSEGPSQPTPLVNNASPVRIQIESGSTHNYIVKLNTTSLEKRANLGLGLNDDGDDVYDNDMKVNQAGDTNTSTNVYVTLNVCSVPSLSSKSSDKDKSSPLYSVDGGLKAFELQASTKTGDWNISVPFFGYSQIILTNLTSSKDNITEIYIRISTDDIKQVNPDDNFWTYQLATSTVAPSMTYSLDQDLFLIDTDFAHALMVTSNYSDPTANLPSKNISDYNFYVYTDEQTIDKRLSLSYCAISTGPALLNQNNMQLSETKRGGGGTKGQVLIDGLNKSSTYITYMTHPETNMIYTGTNFTTKSDNNCQVIYDLDFCSDVAFAVPGNASAFNRTALGNWYDDLAQHLFLNFSRSLENVACNASLENRYSIMRNCDDCDSSYKQWLCAVTIPRCTDWSRNASYLHPRPVGTSRNNLINSVIRPGNYKEILPCADLCYQIVQDCSPLFGFICPAKGHGLEQSYGFISDDGDVTCSYPGAYYYRSPAAFIRASSWAVGLAFSMVLAFI